eukprot:4628302-Amphidinium_carterae.1
MSLYPLVSKADNKVARDTAAPRTGGKYKGGVLGVSLKKGRKLLLDSPDSLQHAEEMIATVEGQAEVEKMLGLPHGALKTREAQMQYLGGGVAAFPAQSFAW